MKFHIFILLLITGQVNAQELAFRGAEGFGRFATGGGGGMVYHVTNLYDSGAGSFRDAVSHSDRIVVFDVEGTVNIKGRIKAASRITIKGQTAPGNGITIYGDGMSFSDAGNVIVRYVRFRGSINMSRGTCTLTADNAHDMIFDHVSVEWGRWDNLHIKNSHDITLQYCIIGEGIDPQRFGALLEGPVNLSVHHCLWINNQSRNPKAKAGIAFVNNVIYNWGSNGFVGGHSAADHYQDVISNYFIAGPESSGSFVSQFAATDHVYQQGNYVDMNKDGKLNGRRVIREDFSDRKATIIEEPHNAGGIPSKVDKPAKAYRKVLREAGASLHRDAVDANMISQLESLGKKGEIIHREEISAKQIK